MFVNTGALPYAVTVILSRVVPSLGLYRLVSALYRLQCGSRASGIDRYRRMQLLG